MEYKLEEISPTEKKISVTTPVEEVNGALTATIALYRKSADIKGFRKGKVPSSMIESRYQKQIYSEATGDLINYHLNEIMSELKETPLSGLMFDGQNELVRDKEFIYSFRYEVIPAFELPTYKGLEVDEEEAVMDKAETQKVLDRLRENLAELKIVSKIRKAKDGDIAIFDFQGYDGDTVLENVKASNFQLEIGRGQALEDFEKILKTLKPGEEGEGDVVFPQDFFNKDLAGKTVHMKISLHTLKEKILPEVNEEFAQKANQSSLKVLHETIEKSYLATKNNLLKSESQKKMLDDLIAKVDFPLPQSVVDKLLNNLVYDTIAQLERQGKNLESVGKTESGLREEYRSKAENLAKSHVFLLALAKAEGLNVSPEEVDMVLRRMAISSGQDFHAIKDFYERNNLMFDLRDSVLADKAMDLVYEQAKITKIPAKENKDEKEKTKSEK